MAVENPTQELDEELLLKKTAAPMAQTPSDPPTSPESTTPSADTEQHEPHNSSRDIKELIEEDFTQEFDKLPPYAEKEFIQKSDGLPPSYAETQAHTNPPTSPEEASQADKEQPPKKKHNLLQHLHSTSQVVSVALGLILGRIIKYIKERYKEKNTVPENAAAYDYKQTYSEKPPSYSEKPPSYSSTIEKKLNPYGPEQNLRGESAYNIVNSDSPPYGVGSPLFNADAPVAAPLMPIPEKQSSLYTQQLEERLRDGNPNNIPGSNSQDDEAEQPLLRKRVTPTQDSPDRDQPSSTHHVEQTERTAARTTSVSAATQGTPVPLKRTASVPGPGQKTVKPPSKALRRTLSSH